MRYQGSFRASGLMYGKHIEYVVAAIWLVHPRFYQVEMLTTTSNLNSLMIKMKALHLILSPESLINYWYVQTFLNFSKFWWRISWVVFSSGFSKPFVGLLLDPDVDQCILLFTTLILVLFCILLVKTFMMKKYWQWLYLNSLKRGM